MFGVYRRKFMDEVIDPSKELKGGNQGGGGSNIEVVVKPDDEAAKAAAKADQEQREKDKLELERLRDETSKLIKFKEAATAHVEYDEDTGEVRAKEKTKDKAPTQDELDRIQLSGEVTETAVRIMDMNNKAEQTIINKYKAQDPLFAESYLIAKEKVMGVPAAQRTEKLWDRAMSLARGEMQEKYASYYKEQGKKAALEEIRRGNGGAIPEGSGSGSSSMEGDKLDLNRIILSREQLSEANKMVAAGLIKNVDVYKENLVYLGEARFE